MKGHRDLRLAVAASVVCAVAALALSFAPVCLVFATPLCLFLPGYAIVSATFARRALERLQILALSVGLSLAVLALGGLVLNYVPGGVLGISWAVLLLLVILNGCRLAALRRPPAAGRPASPRLRISRTDGILLSGGALAAVAALVLAMTPLPAHSALGYTELWLSSRSDPQAPVAQIGVRSQEQQRVAYFLRLHVAGLRPVVRLLKLAPGQTRVIPVPTAPVSGGTVPVVASLFKQSRPTEVYRRVTGWIPSGERQR